VLPQKEAGEGNQKKRGMMTQTVEQTAAMSEQIVSLIEQGNPQGEELLYNTFARGLRYLAVRHCPAYADDCVQDAIMAVICQIRAGQLQTPAALPGYLNIVLKRTAWNKKLQAERVDSHPDVFCGVIATRADARENPEERLQLQDRTRVLREALSQLKPQERELLTRFYLQEQTPEQICEEMGLNETQFRLNKSRSKKKLETLTQKHLQHRPVARMQFAFAS
jgi:RNA polymerase sigma-70 factor, ECF subfamily